MTDPRHDIPEARPDLPEARRDGQQRRDEEPGSPEQRPEPQIADVPIRGRYEALVDGALAGWVEYRRMGRRLVAVHTEVLPAFSGRGISSALVRRVIADARAAGLRISPLCPLFQAHFQRHPEDQDVLAPGRPLG